MMIPSLSARAMTLTVSAAAHLVVVAAAASGGHAPRAEGPAIDRADLTLDVAPPETVFDPVPLAPSVSRARPPVHSHSHPYPVDPDHDATPHDPALVHTHALRAPQAAAAAPSPSSSAAEGVPVVAEAPSGAPPRFTLALSQGGGLRGSGALGAPASSEGEGTADDVFAPSGVTESATCVDGTKLAYTESAVSAGIEPDVPLEVVVDARGHVRSAKVLTPVGYGLDATALAGAYALRCAPAKRDGKAVAVRMRWVARFRFQN